MANKRQGDTLPINPPKTTEKETFVVAKPKEIWFVPLKKATQDYSTLGNFYKKT